MCIRDSQRDVDTQHQAENTADVLRVVRAVVLRNEHRAAGGYAEEDNIDEKRELARHADGRNRVIPKPADHQRIDQV